MTPSPGDGLSRSRRFTTLLVLGLLAGLRPFTIDLQLPAFPAVKVDVGTTDAVVQLTLSATTLGFAFGQQAVGPLSDRVGRRLPLLIATTLHVIASVGVALAPGIVRLSLLRILQGFGAPAGARCRWGHHDARVRSARDAVAVARRAAEGHAADRVTAARPAEQAAVLRGTAEAPARTVQGLPHERRAG